jgi:phosphoribosylanthranilate isomerase
VKICGLTSRRDAFAAVDAGADALGFNFHPASPRRVTPAFARSVVRALPPFVVPVGLFVDRPASEVARVCRFAGLRMAQLHGAEPPSAISALSPLPVMKVIRVRDRSSVRSSGRYREAAMVMFDAYDPHRAGGTGRTFRWSLLRGVRGRFLLAGGLTPSNVRAAIRAVRPFGVDAASGVESSPGRKDHALMRRFVRSAKSA